MSRFLITASLALIALASATVVAFGTHPLLAQYPNGLNWITLARRLQWPLACLCILACVALIGLVVAGKRRAFWLVALAPVLALFYQRFAGDEFRRMAILENPRFVAPEKATSLKPESPVIGLVFEGQPYAYPCGALYLAPVIAHADADNRLLVMYSPYAGRARAFVVDNTVKPRELDIVSMPADALLLYNSRVGQFINAFTGLTPKGDRPEGFHAPVETCKTTWREWRTLNPETRVLDVAVSTAGEKPRAHFPPRPVTMELPADARVSLIGTTRPVCVQPAKWVINAPTNLVAGGQNLLVFRDKPGGPLKVFDRAVKGDLFPTFTRKSVAKKPEVVFGDSDTGSLWTADGLCVDGFAKGDRLRPVRLEADLPYATLKSFYPDLEVLKP